MPAKNSYITATDQFCGAGGSTTGAKNAGVEVKMALNHWELAIETHNTNHPDTLHDCTDVQACDPRRYPSTDILITSPECTNHSLAKGKKRKNRGQLDIFGSCALDASSERSRATMWDVPRFAEYHDYNIIIVENVVDARYWRLWDAWLKAMHDLGYQHKSIFANSMFFQPCPQSRDRMYIVFWKKGNKAPDLEYRPLAHCPKCGDAEAFQSWKKLDKKWGKYKTQYIYRCSKCSGQVMPYYYAAFNAIDWTIPGTRIGDRKKPLADKTIQRIQYGLDKYGKQSLVVTSRYTSGIATRVKSSLSSPIATQPGDLSHSILIPFVVNSEHGQMDLKQRSKSSIDPLWTQTTSQSSGIVVPPFIIELNRTGNARTAMAHLSTVLAGGNHHMLVGNYSPGWTRQLTLPTGTITTSDSHGIINAPIIVENRGKSKSKNSTNPMSTITTNINHGILTQNNLSAFLSYYYNGVGISGLNEAVNTVTTHDRASLITTDSPKIEDCYYRMLKPHEIQRAMSFNDDYIVHGNSREKVRQLGNALTPPVMEWLVKQCVKSLS